MVTVLNKSLLAQYIQSAQSLSMFDTVPYFTQFLTKAWRTTRPRKVKLIWGVPSQATEEVKGSQERPIDGEVSLCPYTWFDLQLGDITDGSGQLGEISWAYYDAFVENGQSEQKTIAFKKTLEESFVDFKMENRQKFYWFNFKALPFQKIIRPWSSEHS